MRWAILLLAAPLFAQKFSDLRTPEPLPANSTLVIGFLGGFERWDDEHRSVRQLALRLREHPGVYAESISNRNRKVALKLIRKAFPDRSHARIILYGQSWGGAAAITTARELGRLGMPVLLTVQVDSVGRDDRTIPRNVRAAINFYQHDLMTIQGRQEIRAKDPRMTNIIGNFRVAYPPGPADDAETWARRNLGGSHSKMELDPKVWNAVEHYILEAIQPR